MGRSGTRDSKRMWPALWRVVRYGAGLPMEAMKRMRLAGFVRSGIVGLGVLVGLVLLDIESKSGLKICQYHVMYKVID